jgi:Ala-tRNA(Pro) deacylase
MKAHIQDFLDARGVPYRAHHHAPRITAQEVAEEEHVSGHRFAKTVVVESGAGLLLAVLPADREIDLDLLEAQIGPVRLAHEDALAGRFRDCELGAMPPFGELYGLPVVVDFELARQETIVFNAGTHEDTIAMAWDDYRLVQPIRLLDFARPWRTAKVA